jgi:hypothetical protein
MSQAGIISIPGSVPSIPTSFTTDSGSAVPIANDLNVYGSGAINTAGSGKTVTISVDEASTTVKGVASFDATDFTVTSGVVTVNGSLSSLTFAGDSGTATQSGGTITIAGGTGITSSASGAIVTINLDSPVSVANGGTGQTSYTNGQLLIGNTSGNTLTKASLTAGSGITITPGAGSITIAATASGLTFAGDSGTASEAGGTITFTGGTGLTSSAAGSTVTFNLDVPVAVASGGTGQTSYTDGQLLIGNTSGNTLTKASLTAGSGITITPGGGSITIAATASGLTFAGDSGTASEAGGTITFTGGTGLTSSAAGSTVTFNLDVPVAVASGGTGQTSYTNGQLLIGNTISNTLSLSTLTAGTGITITNGTGSITIAADADVPTTFTADTGTATPAANTMAVLGTGGIATSGSGATLTIDGSAIVPGNLLINDFEKTVILSQDFVNGTASFYPYVYISDRSAGSTSGTSYVTKDHPGVLQIGDVGPVDNNYCHGIKLGSPNNSSYLPIMIGGGQITLETWFTLTGMPAQGRIFFGISSASVSNSSPPWNGTDFIGFDIPAISSSVVFIAKTRAASTLTSTSTGVSLGAVWQKLSIIINANASSVTFYVDGSLVATHTTNIPADTIAMTYCLACNAVGNYRIPVDFIQLIYELNGDRA